MLEALHLEPRMNVLEIGTGSGYQTALLASIVSQVVSIESVPELAIKARTILNSMGMDNIRVIEDDGFFGYEKSAPYDGIIVSAAAPSVPRPLMDQLSDRGLMIIPVGPSAGIQYLTLIAKKMGKIESKRLLSVRFVPFGSEKF